MLVSESQAQDTLFFPLKIRIGADIYGPVHYYANRNIFASEGYVAIDRDTIKSFSIDFGYARLDYEQYNYRYKCSGYYIRTGIDFNMISPVVSRGRYFAGLSLKYGLSLYSHEVPFFESENYWGKVNGYIKSTTHLAHFIEASPGIRTELFSNVSIGWTIRMMLLVYSGTGKDLKPVYIPGYGNGTKSFSPGINYYISFSIPYKTLAVKQSKR